MSNADTESAVNPGDTDPTEAQERLDSAADVKGILIIFGAALLFAMHFVSQWTFDSTFWF